MLWGLNVLVKERKLCFNLVKNGLMKIQGTKIHQFVLLLKNDDFVLCSEAYEILSFGD